MSPVRPEQQSHKAFLNRGRDTRWIKYTLLVVCAASAGAAVYAALTMTI